MKYLIIFLIGWWTPLLLTGQSLDSLEKQLIEQSPELKAMGKEIEAARARVELAGALPNPRVQAGVLALPTDPGMGMERISVSASQMIPQAGVLRYRTQAAEARLQSLQASYQALLIQKITSLREAYYILYALHKRKQSLSALQENLEALEPVALQAYSAGRSPMSQVLQLKARILELRKEKLRVDTELAAQEALIIQLSASPGQATISLPDTLISTSDIELDSTGLNQHPRLASFQAQQQAQEYQTALANRMNRPMLGAGLQYMRMANGMNGLMPMLMVELPLWRSKNRAMLSESQAMAEAYEFQADAARNELQEAYTSARKAYLNARTSLALTRQQLALQQSIIQQVQTEFSAGTTSLQMLLDEENEYLKLKLAAELALVDMLRAEARLKYIFGSI